MHYKTHVLLWIFARFLGRLAESQYAIGIAESFGSRERCQPNALHTDYYIYLVNITKFFSILNEKNEYIPL